MSGFFRFMFTSWVCSSAETFTIRFWPSTTSVTTFDRQRRLPCKTVKGSFFFVATKLLIAFENTLRLHFQMIRVPVTAFFTYVCWLKINWTHPLWPVVYCSVSEKVQERRIELIQFTGNSFFFFKQQRTRVTRVPLKYWMIFRFLFFINMFKVDHNVKHSFFSSRNFRDVVLISLKKTIQNWNRLCGKYFLCWFYSPLNYTWNWKKK